MQAGIIGTQSNLIIRGANTSGGGGGINCKALYSNIIKCNNQFTDMWFKHQDNNNSSNKYSRLRDESQV